MLIGDFYLGPRQTAIFITIVEGFSADIVGMSNNDSLSLSVIGIIEKRTNYQHTKLFFDGVVDLMHSRPVSETLMACCKTGIDLRVLWRVQTLPSLRTLRTFFRRLDRLGEVETRKRKNLENERRREKKKKLRRCVIYTS